MINRITHLLKNTSLPGLAGVPLWDIGTIIVEELNKDDITIRANSMAFSFLLSIFPLLILIFSLIPFLPYQNLEAYYDYLVNLIDQFLPHESSSFIVNILEDILFNQRGGLLSFSLLLALYFASNGINYMMIGFEKQYKDTFKSRSFLYRRALSIFLTFLLGTTFIVSVVFIFLSNELISSLANYLDITNYANALIIVKYIVILVSIYTIISIVYRFGTNFKNKFGYFSPGATIATLFSVLSSLVFSFYVNNFSNYNQIYGSIGALIILMLWLQLNSYILLFGFELNVSVILNRHRIKNYS